jgi:hypothetical protein
MKLIVFLCVLLAGRDTLGGLTKTASVQNVAACEIATPGQARALVSSWWGWFALTFRLTEENSKVLCNKGAAK